ncbi:MAG: response regulator [Pseudomonadota bacterium]
MHHNSEKVTLYLEDEALIALDGEDLLHEIGVQNVHSARSLKKARAITECAKVELAILDVNLGNGENSFDFARELLDQNTRVLFVSGYNSNEFPADLSSVPILEKPFTKQTLSTALQRI